MGLHTRAFSIWILHCVFVIFSIQMSAQGLAEETTAPPLYDDLGNLHYKVSANDAAQAYFDQGLRLYYAFNHMEAIASFREAQQLDPSCAMCWWGEAISWGPNINLPMDVPSGIAAYVALQQALSLSGNASDKEQMLISALSERYEASPGEDRSALDAAYALSMQVLADRFSEDDDIVVLYAESVMDLNPWDYWTADNELRPGMDVALAGISTVLERSPQHPGACHFFIHAVEKVQPQRALVCAEQLAALMPGAGHIVHMPGHIYIRVGRYLDAVRANEHAVHADETFIQDRQPSYGMYTAGYYPHNYDFLAFAALMVGREEQAIEAADKVASLISDEALHDPSVTYPQHYVLRSALVRIRFGRWQEILAMPEPDTSLPHSQAIWNYAQGRAMLANGDLAEAKRALLHLQNFATGDELSEARLEFNASQSILSIATAVLSALIANAEGNLETALDQLRNAVSLEDALLYGEPPEWTVPVRQELGEVLLAADLANAAEQVFREDLNHFPENVWSLAGLTKALRIQSKNTEAGAIEVRFHEAWAGSGVNLLD